jgi:predicted nucleotidyltransferase
MNAAERTLRGAVSALNGSGVAWALVGGFAVSARAEPRLTRDVDAVVAVHDDDAAEALVHELAAGGWRPTVVVEQDAVGRLATVRLHPGTPSVHGAVLDLLFASSGVEAEIAAEAELLELLPGLEVPVARTGHLVVLKLLARDDLHRPQDAADLRALRPELDATERDRARTVAALVTARGYARDRNLTDLLEEYLES